MPLLPFKKRAVNGATIASLLALAGCDAQASTAYRGEPLLKVSGSVELTRIPSDGDLRPALAFLNREMGEFQIVDVDASGDFPAEITMEVYQPPPEDAFAPLREDGRGAKGALAYITAATADHPDKLQYGTSTGSAGPTTCNGGPCECPESGCVRSSVELCTHDGERCYSEVTTCPKSNSPAEDCTVSFEGDESLKDSPWETFAGVSENYVLLYLKEALPAGDGAGLSMGTREALDQGYNLLAISALSREEDAENSNCLSLARSEALERFNDKHDTEYTALEIAGVQCAGPQDCDHEIATPEETKEYEALSTDIQIERGCLRAAFKTERVADGVGHPISIKIGDSFDPLSDGYLYDSERMTEAP
jgi:hypothetical protein